MPWKPSTWLVVACAVIVNNLVLAQGTGPYLNFESPQLKPITCTTTGTRSFLLVCNSPDNAVEVYSTTSSSTNPTFLTRVPVGLEPVTIITKPTLLAGNVRRCYVANWLGDSVSILDVASTGTVTLQRTVAVGDEPMGLALTPDESQLIITFSAESRWGVFDPTTLQPYSTNSGQIEVLDRASLLGIKDPRAIAFSPATSQSPNIAGRLMILNLRGGNDPSHFDYDLWCTDSVSASMSNGNASVSTDVAGLGSTNFNLAFAPNGDLYVVSQNARNKSLTNFVTDLGGPAMHNLVTASTGFVTSQLVRLRGAGTGTLNPEVVDLNYDPTSTATGNQAAIAITQPTDVVVKGDGTNGNTRVFVTGFDSDTFGMVQPTALGWTVTRVDLSRPTNAFSNSNLGGIMRGPRGLALNAAQDRVYVLNRIEETVSVIDANLSTSNPQAGILNTFALQRDPTPSYIRDGRKFLYSSKLSGRNNVSCASCHIDGTSDFLAWNLSDGVTVPVSNNNTDINNHPGGDPEGFLGPNTTHTGPDSTVYDRKGPMQTQSLRGLVTFEVANDATQDQLFSKRPYHWRGDRETFQNFNPAFVDLMALPPYQGGPNGLPDVSMTQYRDFVNSIHYPPNPEELPTRVYSGSMTVPPGTQSDPYNDTGAGNGAQLGLKTFFIANADGTTAPGGARSCVQCHALPEGSNNRFTDEFGYYGTTLDGNRIETPTLRGLVVKERNLFRTDSATGIVAPVTDPATGAHVKNGEFGLLHTGDTTLAGGSGNLAAFKSDSLVDFVNGFPSVLINRNEVVRFLREFDPGVAPVVGSAISVDPNSNLSTVNSTLSTWEDQASKANAEIAAVARIGAVIRGFWFDVTNQATTPYTEEPQTGLTPLSPMSRATLLSYATSSGNLLVFQSTPLGSSRRVAKLDYSPLPALGTSAPTNVRLQGCKTDTANASVPNFNVNWYDLFLLGGLTSHLDLNVGQNLAMIWFQMSLQTDAASGTPPGFGWTSFHHDPPRRFVVRATGISQGAMIRIYLPTQTDWNTVTSNTSPPTTTPTSSTNPNPLELPIYAAFDSSGILEWQTDVEIEPFQLQALMNGGRNNSSVQTIIDAPQSISSLPSNYFQPLTHNWFYVQVVNDPGNQASTMSAGSWQRLTIQ